MVPSRDVPHADRALAVDLLNDLLDDWKAVPLESVTKVDIGLIELNELEQRFRAALKSWAMAQKAGAVIDLAGEKGTQLSLSFESSDGSVRNWLVNPLHGVKAGKVTTEPDFLLTRQDTKSAQIAVYLDGKAFHASPKHNRTADDAYKRNALRQDGYRVISLTFADVEDWEARLAQKKGKVVDLVSNVTAAAVLGRVADKRIGALWGPPSGLLTALLTDPDTGAWASGAAALTGQVAIEHLGAGPLSAPDDSLMPLVNDWASFGTVPDPQEGSLVVFPSSTASGLPLLVILNPTAAVGLAMGAVTVLDDRPEVVGSSSHDSRWRDWLRWSNVLQFLEDAPLGGAPGWAEVWTQQSLDVLATRYLSFDGPAPRLDVVLPIEWAAVVEYTHPGVHDLVSALASNGIAVPVPVPVPGEEVGEGHNVWQVELAWPDSHVAVTLDDDLGRDDWLRLRGWKVIRHNNVEDSLGLLTEAWEGGH